MDKYSYIDTVTQFDSSCLAPMSHELMWIASLFPPHNTPPKFGILTIQSKLTFWKKNNLYPSIHVNSFGWIRHSRVHPSALSNESFIPLLDRSRCLCPCRRLCASMSTTQGWELLSAGNVSSEGAGCDRWRLTHCRGSRHLGLNHCYCRWIKVLP